MTIDFVSLDVIKEDARQRTFYDEMKISDLADDILANGLIHPIAVREDGETIVAGGRRWRAIRQLARQGVGYRFGQHDVPLGAIPAVRMSAREALAWMEAELAENVQRENLTWQERASAVARLHELRSEQKSAAGEVQTVMDTAREIYPDTEVGGGHSFDVGEDLRLAEHLNDPAIARARSKKDAIKLLKLKKQREHFESLATLPPTHSAHTLILGDALEEMLKLEESGESFSCIITDPPYGIGAHSFSDQTLITHEYADGYDGWLELMVGFAPASFRIAAELSHLYLFCDIRRFFRLEEMMTDAGWRVWPRPFIWDKGNTGTLPRPEHGPRLVYECILFASKGDKRVNHVAHDVIRGIPSTPKPRHAAEKPPALYVELLKRSTKPGDAVLDPFAGSGPIFPAANSLRLRATGIELAKSSYGICTQRLEEYIP